MEANKTAVPDGLLARLDRVGVHQSVSARYCKEAAEEIRALHQLLAAAVQRIDPHGVGLCSDSDKRLADNIRAALTKSGA